MDTSTDTRGQSLNPPIRIFSPETSNTVNRIPFSRPQLKILVNHDRVTRYFKRRGFSFSSSID